MGQLLFYAVFHGRTLLLEHPLVVSALIASYLLLAGLRGPIGCATMQRLTARFVARLEREVAANPDNATSRRELAQVCLRRRSWKKAERLLGEARRRAPDMPELSYLLAQARLAQGDSDAANRIVHRGRVS